MSGSRTNFIVLFQGRTGSSYLIDVLGRHPDIAAVGEMFADEPSAPRSIWPQLIAQIRGARHGAPGQRQLDMTRRFYEDTEPGKRVVGFKTKVKDLIDLNGMKQVLEAAKVRAIVMDRANLVKQAVSHMNAERLHQAKHEWNLHYAQDPLGAFVIDPDRFERVLREVIFDQQTLKTYAASLNVPRLHLRYDDMLIDRQVWFRSVFDFLGVDPIPLESELRKNTPDDLREVVENFDELVDRYRGTEFEGLFEADSVGHAR